MKYVIDVFDKGITIGNFDSIEEANSYIKGKYKAGEYLIRRYSVRDMYVQRTEMPPPH